MVDPSSKQTAFLLLPHKEVLYGGAAGGGKSIAILAAASQYLDVPGYSALILRQTYKDLALPDALMDVAYQWWGQTAAKWKSKTYTWEFPEGSSLTFGYMETEKDKYQYQGAQLQFIGFDELTQFETESRYLYLFSRLRRTKDFDVPLRVRSATNPGGIGHSWVKERFIDQPTEQRLFIPAFLGDNPFLDQEQYEESLALLDVVTREQLRHGDWEIDPRGGMFQRQWFDLINELPSDLGYTVRYWDLAASSEQEFNDPDWTVGTKMSLNGRGGYTISDIIRFRGTPLENEELVRATAMADGVDVHIFMEQEPGASGKALVSHYARNILKGWTFRGDKDYRKSSKEIRAKPFSAAAEDGDVEILVGSWISPWLDELIIFPDGVHDDQVDSSVGAHAMIAKLERGTTGSHKVSQKYRR
jgi:predicted phage terminase large subunit-like protein